VDAFLASICLLRRSPKRVEQLAEPGRFQRQSGADPWQRRRLIAKDRPRAERPDDFIVPHVDHPNVPVGLLAAAGQGQDDVRIDAGHGGVNHFKLLVGMTQAKDNVQHAGQTEAWLRVAVGSRLAKNKNADCAGRFVSRNGNGLRKPGFASAEETPAELIVLPLCFLAVIGRREKKRSWVPESAQTQAKFQKAQHNQRNSDGRNQAKEPGFPARRL